jgi:voltage-gated potassium channel
MSQSRRVLWGLIILIAIISIGVIGYISIEGWSFLDALFMTIITITTVGYGEIHPLSPGGRIFNISYYWRGRRSDIFPYWLH